MIDLREALTGREGFCTAVSAMIEGLKTQADREAFVIDMSSFGSFGGFGYAQHLICSGCAATCALQEYFGVNFTGRNISAPSLRAGALDVDKDTLLSFESAIDALRCGTVFELSEFTRLENKDAAFVCAKFSSLPLMSNEDWEQYLAGYELALTETRREWGHN